MNRESMRTAFDHLRRHNGRRLDKLLTHNEHALEIVNQYQLPQEQASGIRSMIAAMLALYNQPNEIAKRLADIRAVGDLYLQRQKYDALVLEIAAKLRDRAA